MDRGTPVIVLCAASTGWLYEQIVRDTDGWDFRGYLDDNIESLGNLDRLGHCRSAMYLAAIANPNQRQRIVEEHGTANCAATVVHPTAFVGQAARIGEGSVVAPHAFVGPRATIGKHCIVNVGASVAQGSVLGDYCTLSPGARVSGDNRIGDRVFIGTNATTRDHIEVGDDVTIGSNSAVVRNVPTARTIAGVPARRIK